MKLSDFAAAVAAELCALTGHAFAAEESPNGWIVPLRAPGVLYGVYIQEKTPARWQASADLSPALLPSSPEICATDLLPYDVRRGIAGLTVTADKARTPSALAARIVREIIAKVEGPAALIRQEAERREDYATDYQAQAANLHANYPRVLQEEPTATAYGIEGGLGAHHMQFRGAFTLTSDDATIGELRLTRAAFFAVLEALGGLADA